LLFGITSRTPFAELNNLPFLIATTLATMTAFVFAMLAGRFIGGLSLREATLAGLCGGYGNIAATWVAVSRSRCSAPRRRCRRR
jgi:malonate transporter and related proteins